MVAYGLPETQAVAGNGVEAGQVDQPAYGRGTGENTRTPATAQGKSWDHLRVEAPTRGGTDHLPSARKRDPINGQPGNRARLHGLAERPRYAAQRSQA